EVVARVVELPVRVGNGSHEVIRVQSRNSAQRFFAREKTAREEAGAAGYPVIDLKPGGEIGGIQPAEARKDEFHGPREIRRVVQHTNSLVKGALDDAILLCVETFDRLLQIAHAAMDDLGGCAGGGAGKIGSVKKDRRQAAKLRIKGASRARGSAADHANVERLVRDAMQRFTATLHDVPRLNARQPMENMNLRNESPVRASDRHAGPSGNCRIRRFLILQRLQELEDGFLILFLQLLKLLAYVGCLTAVAQDGVTKRQGGAIVHQSRTQADSPQGGGAYFVSAVFEILLRKMI